MKRHAPLAAIAVTLIAATLLAGPRPAADPLAFFEPTVVVTPAERNRLDAGEPFVKLRTIAHAGTGWRTAAQDAFRGLVVDRARIYLEHI